MYVVLTGDKEPSAVALPRLPGVAVARHAPVVVQAVLNLHVQDVQGSRGCDEKPRH